VQAELAAIRARHPYASDEAIGSAAAELYELVDSTLDVGGEVILQRPRPRGRLGIPGRKLRPLKVTFESTGVHLRYIRGGRDG
jgi:hypothetical protein